MKNLSASNNYKEAQVYTGTEKLPIGAYLLKIENVKYIDNSEKGYSDQIVFMFDIAEGEYAGFFKKQYEANTSEDKKWKGTYRIYVPADDGSEKDQWTMSRFKTMTNNFEESNQGYAWNWDETTFKGKVIGAIFNDKEYEYNGKHGFFTNCYAFIAKDKIATAKIPEATLLNKKGNTVPDGFANIPDNATEEEIPFN